MTVSPARSPSPLQFPAGLGSGLLLIFAYVVTGKLGLMLALPPGYASPIFPPAGIALAAALIAGRKVYPWIFLAALLLNLWVSYGNAHGFHLAGLLASLVIALASSLQAALGAVLMKKVLRYPLPLDNGRDVIRFLLLSPLLCLSSATLALSGLWGLGLVLPADVITSWASWWAGDTLGVLILFPMVMILGGEPRALWRSRGKTVAVPMLVLFFLFVLVFVKTSQWEYSNSLAEFHQLSQRASDDIQSHLDEQEATLTQISSFFALHEDHPVTIEEFNRLTERILARYPMIQALEWATCLTDGRRKEFEISLQDRFPDFEIRERDATGRLRSANTRERYCPVTYINPMAGNELALGFDIASTPDRRAALDKALSSGLPVFSPPVYLVQKDKPTTGLLLLMAVDNTRPESGFVLSILNVDDFLGKLLLAEHPVLYSRLQDLDARKTLYDDFPSSEKPALYTQDVEAGTRHYRLETMPTSLYFARHYNWQSWWVLAMGALGSSLLGALFLLSTGYANRIREQVREKTDSLRKSEERLKEAQHIAHIGSWEWDVVSDQFISSEENSRIFGLSPGATFPAYQQYLSFFTPASVQRLEAAVHSALEDKVPYELDLELANPTGRRRWVMVRSMITREAGGKVLRMGGTTQEITHRKEAEIALRESEENLRRLFELSPLGIVLTDMNGRFLEFNASFLRICGSYSDKELKTLDNRALTPSKYEEEEQKQRESLEKTGRYGPYEKEYIHKDGSRVSLRLNGVLVPRGNGQYAVWSIVEDITARKKSEEEIQRLAFYDHLTNLPNRRLLTDRLKQALASRVRNHTSGALLFVDLDNFKMINDTLGHFMGDLLLQQVAHRLSSCVRETDTVARMGGDEFVVMLEGLDSQPDVANDQVKSIADKILAVMARPYPLGFSEYVCTPSIGITFFGAGDHDVENLLKQADIAMYQAKNAGRNTIRVFDKTAQASLNARAVLETELRKALALNQFELYYQVQKTSTGQTFGAEALIRWHHPERGTVSPSYFIPMAEDLLLIIPIGKWVIDQACAQLAVWADNPLTRHLILAVNVSAQQFHQPDFVSQITEALQRHKANPALLEFELTESLLLEDIGDTLSTLNALNALGIQLSLDDFGSGYSSLQYLKRLPLSCLKIDQSFVRDIATDPNDLAIVRTIIAMAESLKLEVIAEGVETEAQRQLLLDSGCRNFQGYLLGKPVPIDQFEAQLQA